MIYIIYSGGKQAELKHELYLPALLAGPEQVSAPSETAGRGQPARRLRRAGDSRATRTTEHDRDGLDERENDKRRGGTMSRRQQRKKRNHGKKEK